MTNLLRWTATALAATLCACTTAPPRPATVQLPKLPVEDNCVLPVTYDDPVLGKRIRCAAWVFDGKGGKRKGMLLAK